MEREDQFTLKGEDAALIVREDGTMEIICPKRQPHDEVPTPSITVGALGGYFIHHGDEVLAWFDKRIETTRARNTKN